MLQVQTNLSKRRLTARSVQQASEILYIPAKAIDTFREKLRGGEELTDADLQCLSSRGLTDHEVMVPIDLRGVGGGDEDFGDVVDMMEHLGAAGVAQRLVNAADRFEATKARIPEGERPRPMTKLALLQWSTRGEEKPGFVRNPAEPAEPFQGVVAVSEVDGHKVGGARVDKERLGLAPCGCAKDGGDCKGFEKPGVSRDGQCLEPGGTHKVCGIVSAKTLAFFKAKGNDLSSVVAPGNGWCMCKHWVKGALCNMEGFAKDSGMTIDWAASDTSDSEVKQMQDNWGKAMDQRKNVLCDTANGHVAGGED